MRILMLNNEFPPLGGGMGTANRALLRYLCQEPEIEVDLITSALGGHGSEEHFSDRIRILKVPVWNVNIHHSTVRELMTFSLLGLPLAFRNHVRKPYNFCFAWSTLPAGVMALALHLRSALPYLVRVTGPDIPGFEQRYQKLYPFISPIIRTTWRHSRTVVAKCEEESAMIRATDRFAIISQVPNGVDLGAFKAGPPIPDDGPLRLICVGRLIERKGQSYLIKAVKKLIDDGIDITLELVGSGDAQSLYIKEVQEKGITRQVTFSGYVPRDRISEHYGKAHVFLLPSYNEGMSVATLEAMSASLPVIITRTGGSSELVEEGINGFTFDWADVETLTNQLRRLATDRALARRMGAASRARAAQYSWESSSEKYLRLFEQMAR
jgi:phosphatidyl-myo-inositol dimannoside synthase